MYTAPSQRPHGLAALGLLTVTLAGLVGGPALGAPQKVLVPPGDELLTHEIARGDDERSLSPYFVILGDDSGTEQLPLKMTSADVDIAGVVADVTVTQVYTNTGATPIEARYVFPASTRAAVYGMTMTIGPRTIVADIQRKAEARANYEAAKARGQSASLLEQSRPNVFEMNVANIMPGDEIEVVLQYTELLVPTDGIYELVYPTVVGPRYSNTPMSQAVESDRFVASPYTHAGEAPTYGFDFTATVATGVPLQAIGSPSHDFQADFESPSLVNLALDPDDTDGARDVVLRYRLAGGEIASGMLLYEGKKENFFMLMAQPPKVIKPEILPPREYIFVLDVSGSMIGSPLEAAKDLLEGLITTLKPSDTFNVMLFSGGSTVMADRSVKATEANMRRAIDVIDNQHGGGGTELLPALNQAYDLPRTPGQSRSVVVVTDGYISVEREVYDLIRGRLDEANLFSFGVGSSVNRYLIEGMAHVGQGEPLVLLDSEDPRGKVEKFRSYIESPVLTGVELDFEGFDAYDIDPPSIPDVLAQRPVVVTGKYRGKAAGTVTLSGWTGAGRYERSFDVSQVRPTDSNRALPQLWARQRIATLDDYVRQWADAAQVEEVTQLGLNYHLLTQYTSFVAIDSLVRNTTGQSTTVDQPLPLPDGVTDAAVGGVMAQQSLGAMNMPAAPPPSGAVTGYGMGGGGMAMAKKSSAPVVHREAEEASLDMSGDTLSASDERVVVQTRAGAVGRRDQAGPAVASADAPRQKDKKTEAKEQTDAEKDAAAPALNLAAPSKISGSVDAALLTTVVNAHQADFEAWMHQALAAGATLKGDLVLKITLDASGRVIKAEAVGGGLKKVKGVADLLNTLRTWTLVPPTAGEASFELRLTIG